MTSLAQQLTRLAVPQARASTVTHDKHRKSLLFDSKEAASLDRDTFYALGITGLQELENIDPTFQEFENTLFDEASKALERSIQTKEVHARLNRKIGRFLHRLSPYFLLKPAQKAMEWLIHRFLIHQYNVDELLACVIPYHDTKIFVRVIQLLDLQKETNKWHWLQPIQTPGVPLSRTALTNHCYKDPGFLQFVCELVPSAIKAHKGASAPSAVGEEDDGGMEGSGGMLSRSAEALLRVVTCFYCSAVIGAIEIAKPVTEKLLSGILPYLLKGLKSRFSDYQASSYMITCQLAIKVKMKSDLVDPLITSICKHLTSSLSFEGLSCIAILCHTQPVQELPESAFQRLCTVSGTIGALEALASTPNGTAFLRLFITRLMEAALHSAVDDQGGDDQGTDLGEVYWSLLESIVQRVDLDASLTKEITKLFMNQYLEVRKGVGKKAKLVSSLKEITAPVVAALDRKYPEAMDLAVGSCMSQGLKREEHNHIQEFISMSASATRHKYVSGADTTLFLSLNHANPDVRLLGVQHLEERIETSHPMDEFMSDSLLQRLRDENLKVVNAALGIGKALCNIRPEEELFDILKNILLKGKMKTKKGRNAVKLSLELLTDGSLWKVAPESRQCLIPLIVRYLLHHHGTVEDDLGMQDIFEKSSIDRDFKIFDGVTGVYQAAKKQKLAGSRPEITYKLVESMARNLTHVAPKSKFPPNTGSVTVGILFDQVNQPHSQGPLYNVLLGFLMTRVVQLTEDPVQKLTYGTQLLKHLETAVRTMLEPDFAVVEPVEPLAKLNPSRSTLPLEMHAHLACLQTLKKKPHREGDSPRMHRAEVEATLWCLETLIQDIKIPSNLKTETKLWAFYKNTAEHCSVYLTWLLRLFDLLSQAASMKGKKLSVVPEFQSLLSKVIQEHLCTPDLLWCFFSLVWTMRRRTQANRLYPVSLSYEARCLHIGITSCKEKVMSSEVAARLLGDQSEVFPSLLMVLSSDVEPIRAAGVRCLQGLVSSQREEELQNPYFLLGQFLITKAGEITADAKYLKQAFKLYFASVNSAELGETAQDAASLKKMKKKLKAQQVAGDVVPKKECLECFLAFCSADETPSFFKRQLLSLLSKVKNKHIVLLLLDLLSKVLAQVRQDQCPASEDEAVILETIVKRFVPETAGVLEKYFGLLCTALVMQKNVLPDRKSPQEMILKQLTPDFFSAIPTSHLRQALVSKLIDELMNASSPTVLASINHTLRKLPLTAEQIVTELDKFNVEGKVSNLRQAKKSRRSVLSFNDGSSETEARRWQRVELIMELLQKKRLDQIEGVAQLVPAMFTLLSRCLEMVPEGEEGSSSVEYLKQLLLTTVLNVCDVLSPDHKPLPTDVLGQDQFNVELVVQCIRTTDSPQTHRHALMLLAAAAGLFPEHVLHNIMAIFTFMGANMLHRDDVYSFQIIQRTVETVIPALMKASGRQTVSSKLEGVGGPAGGVDEVIVMVMRVFADAFPHIPEHRRLPLFSQVLSTVGEERYLSKMLALLIGGFVTKGAAAMHPGDDTDIKGPGRSIDFWLALYQQFSPEVQISSLTKLLEYVATLTEGKENVKKTPALASRRPSARAKQAESDSSNQEPVFDADPLVRARQLRQFRFTALCFMPHVVSSKDFTAKITAASYDGTDTLKKLLQRLLEILLGYITQVAQSVQRNAGKDTVKFWKALLHRTYDALDKVNALLPARIFVDVIAHLLGNRLSTIRRKAMDLLNNKLLQHQDYFDKEQNEGLLGLLTSLLTIATATRHQGTLTDEVDVNRHTALYSLKLLCVMLGESNVTEFEPVLEAAVTICEEENVNTQVQGSAMLCLAECVRSMRAHSIRYLPRLMPRLLKVLASKDAIVSSDLHLLSAVTAVQKVTETLPHFQSPYLVDLLLQVCRLSVNVEDEKSQLNLRLRAVSQTVAGTIAVRVLLPVFSQAYEKMVSTHKESIGPLMTTMSNHIAALDKTDMTGYQQELVTFFLTALDYRAKHADEALVDVEVVEERVVSSVLTLVMKLSESSFRPVLLKVFDWATRGSAPKERLLTLYRLSDAIADKLKSLFTLFAGHLVAKAADLLDSNNTLKTDKPFFGDAAFSQEKSSLLLVYLMDCLHKCFLYDKGGFTTKERFQRLMHPLVDQIENMQGTDAAYQDRVANHLNPCITQLLVASHDSSTWQPLNYQVLLKTRHTSPKVRFAALTILQELHKKLAEDYLSLLPETIPFLAELMEDESVEVEQQCQLVVTELEKTLGEPLQKYF